MFVNGEFIWYETKTGDIGPTDCTIIIRELSTDRKKEFLIDTLPWKILAYGKPSQDTLRALMMADTKKDER